MTRIDRLLSGIDKTMAGLEVAPWFAPIAAKRDGYNIRILDVFDRDTLRKIGEADPQQNWRDMSMLEDVDFVGSATEIASLIPADQHGTFDYIVSSHNFEHLPNPIKFLVGCGLLLKPGGVVTMAVPDRRATFDYFRPHTSISDWIAAFFEDRTMPTAKQAFDNSYASARLRRFGEDHFAHTIGQPLQDWRCIGDADKALQVWTERLTAANVGYTDCHCTIMTPAILELLLLEARLLGLIGLDVESVSETAGCEFFVRLRRPRVAQESKVVADINERRSAVMRRVVTEYGVQSTTKPDFVRALRHGKPMIGLRKMSRVVRGFGRRLRGKPVS